jgi:hypothetical protein
MLLSGIFFNVLNIVLMKHQFVLTRTMHQTEIATLVDSWVTNTTSVKMLCPQKKIAFYILVKT